MPLLHHLQAISPTCSVGSNWHFDEGQRQTHVLEQGPEKAAQDTAQRRVVVVRESGAQVRVHSARTESGCVQTKKRILRSDVGCAWSPYHTVAFGSTLLQLAPLCLWAPRHGDVLTKHQGVTLLPAYGLGSPSGSIGQTPCFLASLPHVGTGCAGDTFTIKSCRSFFAFCNLTLANRLLLNGCDHYLCSNNTLCGAFDMEFARLNALLIKGDCELRFGKASRVGSSPPKRKWMSPTLELRWCLLRLPWEDC